MSDATDPIAIVEWLTSRKGATPPVTPGDTHAAGDDHQVLADLAAAADGGAAIHAALSQPATIEILMRLSLDNRAAYEALLFTLRKTARADAVNGLKRAVTAATRQHRHAQQGRVEVLGTLAMVRSSLPDAPVPEGAMVPLGWRLGPTAVAREHTSKDETGATKSAVEVIAPAPVVITGRLSNVNDGTEAMRIGWRRDNSWRQATVNRDVIANARELVKVSGLGLPVTSGTSGDLVRYLAAFEAVNLSDLPKARVSHQLGWQGEQGSEGFLWGRTMITPDGSESIEIDLDAADPSDWQEDWLAFRGEDEGDDQLAEGYIATGSFDDWRESVAPVVGYPAVILALYASLAAPLLDVIGAQNFVIDWSHMTSTGKTTVLRLAASVWGVPDERGSAAALHTWDATNTWLERAASTLQSLPLILDDTKRARKPEFVAKTIYDFTSGRGRGRGSVLGTRRTLTWRTVLLSSGESRITDFSQDGGTRPRVLELWGMPFGGTGQAEGAVVQRLNAALSQAYGHAGPRFVRYLLQHRKDWPVWREQFRKAADLNRQRAKDNPFAGRIAEPVAVLTLVEALACAALDLPWGFQDVASGLWETLAGEAKEADRAAAALTVAVNWAHAHASQFHPRSSTEPTGVGWAGRWDDGLDWKWIGFFPERLRAILVAEGFDAESIVRLWHDRGWLVSSEKHRTHVARVGDNTWRLVAIHRKVAEGAGDDDA